MSIGTLRKKNSFITEWGNLTPNVFIPEQAKLLPPDALALWQSAYMAEYGRLEDIGVYDEGQITETCILVAWGVVRYSYRENGDGTWTLKVPAREIPEGWTKNTFPDGTVYWSLGRIPIFKVGTYHDYTFEPIDLSLIYSNFTEPVPMGLSHESQWYIASLGLAHAGLIVKMYLNKSEILADIDLIPDPIAQLLFKQKYGHRSSVIEGYEFDGEVQLRIARVDWLGYDMPAVPDLGTISELWGMPNKVNSDKIQLKFRIGGKDMKFNNAEAAAPTPVDQPAQPNAPSGGSVEERLTNLENAMKEIMALVQKLVDAQPKQENPVPTPAPQSSELGVSLSTDIDSILNDIIDTADEIPEDGKEELKKEDAKVKSVVIKYFRVARQNRKSTMGTPPQGRVPLKADTAPEESDSATIDRIAKLASEELNRR